MNPTGGVGALMAISDAVTLANWISTLGVPEVKDCEKIFKQYKAERYPAAKEAFESSQLFSKTLGKVRNGYDIHFLFFYYSDMVKRTYPYNGFCIFFESLSFGF